MFDNYRTFETTLAGKPIKFETGKLAGLANGACVVTYGETVVMVNITMAQKPREGIEFFPLSVDFEDKLYAAGKIPGSFMRREGRPTEKAVLTSRLIDRHIRPLFPSDMRNDVTVVATVLSYDPDYSPEVCAMVGTSFALAISDIPWNGPTAGVYVGYVDGRVVVCPDDAQRKASECLLVVTGKEDSVNMLEFGGNQVAEDIVLEGIKQGHAEVARMCQFIAGVQAEIGKPKYPFESMVVDADMYEAVKDFAIEKIRHALDTDDKNIREERLLPVYNEVHEKFDEVYPEQIAMLGECLYKLQKYVVRRWLLDDGKRVDGRGIDEMRPLASEVGLLPRTHGSGLFTRGQTQVLAVATLAPVSMAQIIDDITDETRKRYMHHYNFPSYSVGETRPSRGPGRREQGHGALAEKALLPVLPSVDEFPYSLRVVSEVVSSNGSTSQGAICGSTLALMDAGVPISDPVAGISCGLITEGDRWMTMVDIQGVEDFFGDMDFKVGGTHRGITAIQVDMKVEGISFEIIADALEKTRKARLYILDEIMLKAIPEPRAELSKYAPKMLTLQIHPDKIREVIGSGGKVIQKISAECEVHIDIEDDGRVFVSGVNLDGAQRAVDMIKTIAMDPEVGAVYKGIVTRLMNFGAFVEIAPGKEGLVHISKLDVKRVEKVEDVVTVGDEVLVKVTEIDSQGRINLSRRDVLIALEEKNKKAEEN